VDIEIRGLDELVRKAQRMGRETQPMLTRTMDRAIKYVHSQVPPYPPAPPDSRYRRTGLLGRSIATEVRALGGTTVGVIGTNVVYAPDVISNVPANGRGPQMWYHTRTGWYTLQGVVGKAESQVVAIFEAALDRLIGD
jgi:hypothetical protein